MGTELDMYMVLVFQTSEHKREQWKLFPQRCLILTFANRGSVHYPYQGRTVFTVCRDAILGGLKDVAIVLFHLNEEISLFIL